MSVRWANGFAGLVLCLIIPGCAARGRYVPAEQPATKRTFPDSVNVTIVPDNEKPGFCKKNAVGTLLGRNNESVSWHIINNCTVDGKPRTVTVTIDDFRIKHKGWLFGKGKPPFPDPKPAEFPPYDSNKKPQPIMAKVPANPPDDDYRGVNVYPTESRSRSRTGQRTTTTPRS